MKRAARVPMVLMAFGLGNADLDVYFGCGCFWRVQYAFAQAEMSELNRTGKAITARTAYAGGTGAGGVEHDHVCYHNDEGIADYGDLGHAEVVKVTIPESSLQAFARTFWSTCPNGTRPDYHEYNGDEYRSVIGIPGGTDSPLIEQVKALRPIVNAKNVNASTGKAFLRGTEAASGIALEDGFGNEPDTLGTGKVLVYDSNVFPAYLAEKRQQFCHDTCIEQHFEKYSSSYTALRQFAEKSEGCPGDHEIDITPPTPSKFEGEVMWTSNHIDTGNSFWPQPFHEEHDPSNEIIWEVHLGPDACLMEHCKKFRV